MSQQRNIGSYRSGLWERTRWPRYTFIAGIVLGVILGWLLHGVITFLVKFSLVVLVLAILVALFFLWRAYTGRDKRDVTVVSWDGYDDPSRPR